IESEGHQQEAEGCLSLPDRWGVTSRPMRVTVKYLDRKGKERTLTGEGLLARAICHETDHLDGKLFIDVMIREAEED
ncbi:MAG: peptide deformylase, partial [Clostridia bacterium]|nr:peptide deformylase [Clostridia bacterium]